MAGKSVLDTADGSSLVDPTPSGQIAATVYIIRHGRTALDVEHRSDSWLDLPLSDEGQLELIDSQQYLKTIPIDCIYAPSLIRTQETAKIIQSGTLSKPDIETTDDAKTWNLGVLAGTKKEQGRPKVKELMASPDRAPMGGETYNQFRERFLTWFEEQADEAIESGKPILIVCSGSNLRCLGQELFGDMDKIDLDEGGLAALHHVDGEWHEEVLFGHEDA